MKYFKTGNDGKKSRISIILFFWLVNLLSYETYMHTITCPVWHDLVKLICIVCVPYFQILCHLIESNQEVFLFKRVTVECLVLGELGYNCW